MSINKVTNDEWDHQNSCVSDRKRLKEAKMIRRKASGIIAALFAAGMITGSVFAEENVPVEMESTPAETVTETVAEDVENETIDASPEETEASAQESSQNTDGEAADETAKAEENASETEDSDLEEESDLTSEDVTEGSESINLEPEAEETSDETQEDNNDKDSDSSAGELSNGMVDIITPEVTTEQKEAAAEVSAPSEVLNVISDILNSQKESEEVTLIVEHHFHYEQDDEIYDFSDFETFTGLEEGEIFYDEFDYCDEFECAKCLNGEESLILVKGENTIRIEYTMADAFMVV